MRVAHIGNYKPGTANGVNQTIAGLAEHLPQLNVEVEVWHFTPKVDRIIEHTSNGVAVFDVPSFAARATNAILLPNVASQFLKQRSRRIDLLHLHSVFTPANVWAARVGVPYVLTPNGGYSTPVLTGRRRYMKQFWLKGWERKVWRRCAAIHAVSPAEANELQKLIKGVPVVFVPNGIDEGLISSNVLPPHEGRYFLFLGRLAIDHKGLDLLLQGYHSALQAARGELPQLVIAGPDFRGGRQQLVDSISSLELDDHVRLLGPVYGEEKWNLIGAARCFVHTSRWEGLPFAVLEAMALGRPVLLTPQTNLLQFVRDYGVGWLTDLNVHSIASALLQAAQAPSDALRMCGERAQCLIRERFTWPVVAAEIRSLYVHVNDTAHAHSCNV